VYRGSRSDPRFCAVIARYKAACYKPLEAGRGEIAERHFDAQQSNPGG
jgi:hypothetical protein